MSKSSGIDVPDTNVGKNIRGKAGCKNLAFFYLL